MQIEMLHVKAYFIWIIKAHFKEKPHNKHTNTVCKSIKQRGCLRVVSSKSDVQFGLSTKNLMEQTLSAAGI